MATKSLLEAFGYAKPRSRKLNARQLRSLILNEARRPLSEKASADKVEGDKFPMPLSSVNPELATKLVTTGAHDGEKDDDVIAVGPGNYSAADLSPSQTSMDVNKAWWFALGMINGTMYGSGGPGGDLGAFISSDNYIMDGHHRWIATAMADPSASIKGIKVDFPGTKLVAVLNAATVGLGGNTEGKSGSGGFDQFQSRDAMLAALQGIVDGSSKFKGVAGEKKTEAAVKVIEEWTGKEGEEAVEAAVDKAMDNLSGVKGAAGGSAVMPGAPPRKDMPVIDDEYWTKNKPAVEKTSAALAAGEIDVNPPYGEIEGEDDEEKKANESVWPVRRDDLVLERWQKLAGLLKS